MSRLYTREQANEILARGYPNHDQLDCFPLGDLLKKIPDMDTRYGDHESGHISRVMQGINILLGTGSHRPHHIVREWSGVDFDPAGPIPRLFSQTRAVIFEENEPYCRMAKQDFEAFFRILGVYHDIGKSVIKSRHPTVGWHLIRDVHKDRVEHELYPFLLNVPYEEWQNRKRAGRASLGENEKRLIKIFEDVIKFHDLFGVLSTGEASLPVMGELLSFQRMDPNEAKERLSILMLFNLADLYGSVNEVYPYKVELYCKDWKILCDSIEEAGGRRKKFFDIILEIEQTHERALERVRRFLNEEAPDEWRNGEIDAQLEDSFRQANLGTMHHFFKRFALLCKLEYALVFKRHFMRRAKELNLSVNKAMNEILWVLVQLTRQYGDICVMNDGTYRRIGVDLSGLTRTDAITETICDLILKHDMGKEWAMGECTIWFMEE